jgi:hypothetical protein
VTITPKAEGSVSDQFRAITTKAGVHLKFSRSGAVVFSATECEVVEIDDLHLLERRLRQVEEWDVRWVIVTTLILASSATILVSEENGADAELRADAGVEPAGLRLADLSVGFALARSKGMAVKLVAKGQMTPLYQAHRMYQPPRAVPGREHWELVEV